MLVAMANRPVLVAVMAVVLGGCGGGSSTPGADLDGTWGVELNSACAGMMTFEKGQYVDQLICRLQDGAYGTELTGGGADFSVSGRVKMTPRRSSCPPHAGGPVEAGYSIQAGNLTLVVDTGGVIFQRIPNSGGGGTGAVVRFGCWSMGKFQTGSLQDL
jgi:hypothetical protein